MCSSSYYWYKNNKNQQFVVPTFCKKEKKFTEDIIHGKVVKWIFRNVYNQMDCSVIK